MSPRLKAALAAVTAALALDPPERFDAFDAALAHFHKVLTADYRSIQAGRPGRVAYRRRQLARRRRRRT